MSHCKCNNAHLSHGLICLPYINNNCRKNFPNCNVLQCPTGPTGPIGLTGPTGPTGSVPQIGFLAFTLVGTTPYVGGTTIVNFPTEVYDTSGNFTDPIFTAPINGVYGFTTKVGFDDIVDPRPVQIQIISPGNPPLSATIGAGDPSNDRIITGYLLLNAGDQVFVRINWTGANINVLGGGYFTGAIQYPI